MDYIRKNGVTEPAGAYMPGSYESERVTYGNTNVKDELDTINSNLAGKTIFNTDTTFGSDTNVTATIALTEDFTHFNYLSFYFTDVHAPTVNYFIINAPVDVLSVTGSNETTYISENIGGTGNHMVLMYKSDNTHITITTMTNTSYWTRHLVKVVGH